MRGLERVGRRLSTQPAFVAVLAILGGAASAGEPPMHFLVTNDDTARSFPASTATFYSIRPDGGLTGPISVSTGGNGMAGGYFGIARLVVAATWPDTCVYASNAQSENIAAIDARTRTLTGRFPGSRADNKLARDGIGITLGGGHLYAAFSGSHNIGTFQMEPGCKLKFLGDLHAQGLSGGAAEGIAINGRTMVVTYGDGSIESFDTSGGVPVSHGDAQNATDGGSDLAPGAVDITRDGHYAIFGGGSTASAVLVSDISSGKLTAATLYNLGTAWNSGSVRLSPDETVLYVSNNSGGRVTAAFFDKDTGRVRRGCTSSPLKGFYSKFNYAGAVATELASGTGGLLYVAEFGPDGKSYVGLLRFHSAGAGCTLTETLNSPVASGSASALLSIGVYPPRPF